RLTTSSAPKPFKPSAASGPMGTRPQVGFNPTRPQEAAGMRMEPPPSLACATGTMPEATAAAEPPEEPPADTPCFHGLCTGPCNMFSVVRLNPISGDLERPRLMSPAA